MREKRKAEDITNLDSQPFAFSDTTTGAIDSIAILLRNPLIYTLFEAIDTKTGAADPPYTGDTPRGRF